MQCEQGCNNDKEELAQTDMHFYPFQSDAGNTAALAIKVHTARGGEGEGMEKKKMSVNLGGARVNISCKVFLLNL